MAGKRQIEEFLRKSGVDPAAVATYNLNTVLDESSVGSYGLGRWAPELENRSIFVGYPYALPKDDYRGVFAKVAEEHDVEFLFADKEITNRHILEKIAVMMSGAAFSLFDITSGTPTLPLS